MAESLILNKDLKELTEYVSEYILTVLDTAEKLGTLTLREKALLFLGMNLSNPSLLKLAELFLVFGSSNV